MANLKQKVFRHIQRHYQPIDAALISDSQFAFNNLLCFENAVQAYRAGRANKVWMVWAGKQNGVLHFINSNDNIFFDETWVDKSKPRTYYVMREVMPWEFDDIVELFKATRYDLINTCGNWFNKLCYYYAPNSTL